ncbi:MAG: SUMF1/EgtB/PvdO family nonheme iron enzyme [Myxococcota bacterium]
MTRAWPGRVGPGFLLLAATACGERTLPPEGQVLLYVDTDAPLPAAPGDPPREIPALFDRLRIDIIPEGEDTPCDGCTRIFSLDHDAVDAGEASVGIVPGAPGERARVRIRLYRSGGTASAEPRPLSTIERFVRLPAVDDTGVVEASVFLPATEVGQVLGSLASPREPTAGRDAGGRTGRWPGPPAPCPPDLPPGRLCVPGGAFWMGDPRLDLSSVDDTGGERERLVVLSTFIVDAAEVTVGAIRASGVARLQGGVSADPSEVLADCTYTAAPGGREALPVNCVTWFTANAHCEAVGGALPTEAQLEFLRSARGRSRFVWGEAAPECGDAVYAAKDQCAGVWPPEPAPAGSAVRDRLALPGGEAVDLAANVAEWARDRWQRDEEPCWAASLAVNPVCDTPSAIDDDARSFRGSAWEENFDLNLPAATRRRLADEMFAVSSSLGFRCVYPSP